MKRFIYINLLTILLMCIGTMSQPISAAQKNLVSSSLKVSPVIIPIDLRPNTLTSQEITLENLTNNPAPLRANFSDFTSTDEDGGYTFTNKASNPLLSWSHVEPQEIIIPPHAKQTVKLTIHTPSKIPVGGYFGMLFFEPVLSDPTQATQVVPRIGVLILGSVGVQNASAQPISFETLQLPLVTESINIPLLLRAKNTGLQYLTVKPLISISSLLKPTTITTLEDKVIFPGKIRRWEQPIRLPDTKLFSIYTIKVALSLGGGKTVDTERIVIVFPYRLLVFGVVIILLCFFIFKKRKNLKKAVRILISNKQSST